MDFNHVPADVRWAIANWPENTERGAVTRLCERHGISRSVFYKIRAQVREVGPVGATEPGSRRPHHSPSRTDASAALRYRFEELVLEEVVSFTAKTNLRSARVMRRIGMVLVGAFEHTVLPEGHRLRPHVLYRAT